MQLGDTKSLESPLSGPQGLGEMHKAGVKDMPRPAKHQVLGSKYTCSCASGENGERKLWLSSAMDVKHPVKRTGVRAIGVLGQ